MAKAKIKDEQAKPVVVPPVAKPNVFGSNQGFNNKFQPQIQNRTFTGFRRGSR